MKESALVILIISALLPFCIYGQTASNITFETATLIDIGVGANVCADTINIKGTYSGGGTICLGALPVTMLSFTAKNENNNVTLNWVTSIELNNSGFTVERRLIKEALTWESLTFIRGSGTTTEPVNYVFMDKKLNTGTYQYRLKQIDYNGNYEYHSLNGDVTVKAPAIYSVGQNYPNPSNPSSKIDFQLPLEGKVTIKIFDVTGKEVATILNDYLSADFHTAVFNGTNFASGVYFYTLTAGDFVKTNKMILVK
jgi:hypothetical protein